MLPRGEGAAYGGFNAGLGSGVGGRPPRAEGTIQARGPVTSCRGPALGRTGARGSDRAPG